MTHLRIEFTLVEVAGAGEAPVADPRSLTMGADVRGNDVRGFFDRCRCAAEVVMGHVSSGNALVLMRPIDRRIIIQVIKALRRAVPGNRMGLKEAKDAVEAPPGAPMVVFQDARMAERALATLVAEGLMCADEAALVSLPWPTTHAGGRPLVQVPGG